jgi:DNA repair exonuclease SbcCD ATPase subunit
LTNYWIEHCNGWLYHQLTKMEQMTEPVMERLLAIMEKLVAKMMADLDAYQEKMAAWLEEMKDDRKETTPCQEVAKSYSEEMRSVVHQEVPKAKAVVETVRALEDQYGDWHLDVGHRQQPKKWTQADGGS